MKPEATAPSISVGQSSYAPRVSPAVSEYNNQRWYDIYKQNFLTAGKQITMTKIPFKVSSRTARLIGRENVSNAEGALIELVKNAHDADATNAFIIFDEQDLYIVDNGNGMTGDVIEDAWMTIGTDNKEINPYTEKKRVKAGAKGIGRFAMDRLGNATLMHTVPKGKSAGFRWQVDWESFEAGAKSISDVTADYSGVSDLALSSVLPSGFSNTIGASIKNGTVIHISGLRDKWSKDDITKLYQNLETLVSSIEQDDFTITLFATDFPSEFGLVNSISEDDFDSKILATYDSRTKKIQATIYRNELDVAALNKKYAGVFDYPSMRAFPYDLETFRKGSYKKDYDLYELIPGLRDYSDDVEALGDFSMTVIFMKNQPPSGKDLEKFPYKNTDYSRRKEWLSHFGGIKVFRDNFRVRPYGEVGDDWLKLGQRKAKSPGGAGQAPTGFRFGPNQLSGGINISRIKNLQLEDKSSREGIKENDTFSLFKNIVLEIIGILEEDRNHTFYPLSEMHKVNNENELKKQRAKKIADRLNKKPTDTSASPVTQAATTEKEAEDLAAAYDVLEDEIVDKNEEIKKFFEDEDDSSGSEDLSNLGLAKDELLQLPKKFDYFILTGQAVLFEDETFSKFFPKYFKKGNPEDVNKLFVEIKLAGDSQKDTQLQD